MFFLTFLLFYPSFDLAPIKIIESSFDPNLYPYWSGTNGSVDFNQNGTVGVDDFIIFMLQPQSSVYLIPAADVHFGLSPGAPEGYITPEGALDISGMSIGDSVFFDFYYENFDYTLAAFEFQIFYPPGLLQLSENDLDWKLHQGNVIKPGDFITGFFVQLPADNQGNSNANAVDNQNGTTRIGILWTAVEDRPVGTPGAPNPGGMLVRMQFELTNVPVAGPNPFNEAVSVLLTFDQNQPFADIFANENAIRELVNPAPARSFFGLATTSTLQKQPSAPSPIVNELEPFHLLDQVAGFKP